MAMNPRTAPQGLLWPQIEDGASADRAARLGRWAAFILAVVVLVIGLQRYSLTPDPWDAGIDLAVRIAIAALLVALGYGTGRGSRVCALLVLGYALFELALGWVHPGGILLYGVILLLAISGVRGTFARRTFMQPPVGGGGITPPASEPPVG